MSYLFKTFRIPAPKSVFVSDVHTSSEAISLKEIEELDTSSDHEERSGTVEEDQSQHQFPIQTTAVEYQDILNKINAEKRDAK